MSLMGSLLPLLLFIPVVIVQGRPTLATPVRGKGTLHQFGDSSMGAGEKEDTPGILCVQVLLDPSRRICQIPNLSGGLT